jgi:hypothetical protein
MKSLQCMPLCSQDADCPTLACRNGQCVTPPTAEAAASCQVTPDFVIGHPGMQVRFDIRVRDAAGEPLVPADGIRWAAASEVVTGGGEGTWASFTLATPGESSEAVEGRVGQATCRARVTVLPAHVPPGQVRVIVTDELTGRPLQEAVVAASGAEGSITGSSQTDAQGVAWVPATGEVSLTVFHPDYNYLTLAHYDTETGTRDLVLPLRRTPQEFHGGSRGTFVQVPASNDLLLGITGMSMPALGLDLDDNQLTGPSVQVPLKVLGNDSTVKLVPSTYLSLASTVIQGNYSAPGVAGLCDDSLSGPSGAEQAIRSSTCGTRTGWALAGEVHLTELSDGAASGFGLAQVLLQNPAVLRNFSSSVVRDVQFRLKPTPGAETNQPNYQDTTHYTLVNHDFQQVPLGFQLTVKLPTPPRHLGTLLNKVSILATVDAPEQGIVLLGLGSAKIQDEGAASTLAQVRMAPAHHGLEGNPYRLLISARSTESLSTYTQGSASSGFIVPLTGLPLDPRTSPSVTVPGSFPPIPDHAFFNFNEVPYQMLLGREFRFASDPGLQGATVLRVLFTDHWDRRWDVLMDPRRATEGVLLPMPPAPFQDRTRTGDEENSRANLKVQVIYTRKADGSRLDLMSLAEAQEAGLARLSDFMSAISERNYGHPTVAWVNPTNDVSAISHDSRVRVSISNFHISSYLPDDGHVMLTFEGGSECTDKKLYVNVDTDESQVEIPFTIPSGCSGNNVRITATLVSAAGIPLSPLVSVTRLIHIN